jgi:prepilin-type N-terminal cleavage/methylation domain-containing protein
VLRRPGAFRDEGFTLVELLVALAVMGIVLGTVATMSFVAVRTAAASRSQLDDSGDLLLAATYFGDDVAGAQSVSTGSTPRCGTDASTVVELVGQDFTDDSTFTITTTVVSYVLRTVAADTGTRRELHRLACTAATATPAYPLTPVTDVPVVTGLATAAASCGSAGCAAFSQVDLTVQETGGLSYTLTGRRRTTP